MVKKLNNKKYRNAILYFVECCNNGYLGATKLNKLMYYFDFVCFRDSNKSITGDIYVHKDYGPVPESIDDELVALKRLKKIAIEFVSYKDGHTCKFEVKKKPNMNVFSKYEKGLLRRICDKFKNWPTKKIVSQTHLEAPWFYSKPYEVVDYKYSNDIDFFM